MISYIKGKLVHKEPGFALVEANGIGYHIKISLQTYTQLGDEELCKLLIHFHVREDAQLLYGFKTEQEREIFQLLISISGVGSNTALVILSSLSPAEIQDVILREDARTIQSIKGIGAKTAQRIILELKDKIAKIDLGGEPGAQISFNANNNVREEALTALMTLGIAKAAAEKSIDRLLKKTPDAKVEELIKGALMSA